MTGSLTVENRLSDAFGYPGGVDSLIFMAEKARGTGLLFVTGKDPVITGKHAQMTGSLSRQLTGKFHLQSLWEDNTNKYSDTTIANLKYYGVSYPPPSCHSGIVPTGTLACPIGVQNVQLSGAQ